MARRRYSAVLKSRVATEALKGYKTISEIASEYEVHPNQVSKWKKRLQDRMQDIFTDSGRSDRAEEKVTDKLYQEIGRLKVELDWLKKGFNFKEHFRETRDDREMSPGYQYSSSM